MTEIDRAMSIEVTQADRDAAAHIYEHLFPKYDLRAINIRLGNIDDGHVVQTLARHRQQAVAAEVAQMVTWLRGDTGSAWSRDVIKAALAIERGEYKETGGE